MQTIQLIHNPTAGSEEHTKEELIKLVEDAGYTCWYTSTKDADWKDFKTKGADLVIVAGGDGTVRKVCKQLLKKKHRKNNLPVALMPLGTANNLAKTLETEMEPKDFVAGLKNGSLRNFGIGNVENVKGEKFFMESFGFGVFPYLMMEMKKQNINAGTPDDELKAGLKMLRQLVLAYPPKYCQLEVDGVDHSGTYIMAEVMNIKSIGPNLVISPGANPSDPKFEVVMVAGEEKEKFAAYLERALHSNEETYEFIDFRGSEIKISWEGTHVHVDDKLVKMKEKTDVKIEMEDAVFKFLIPAIPGSEML